MRAHSLFAARTWPRSARVLQDPATRVLVALDFDGTIATIASEPQRVRLSQAILRRLRRAAAASGVTLVVVSARRGKDLAWLLPVPRLRIAAHYGLEGPLAPSPALRRRYRRAATRIQDMLAPLVAAYPGAWLEPKGMTVSLHDRPVPPARLGALHRATSRIARGARQLGFDAVRGSRVTEFVPRGYDKGRVLTSLRRQVEPGVVFYFGDSEADEPAFAKLRNGDFGVRVGSGATGARYRVRGPEEVARFLDALVSLRAGSVP